MKTAARKKQERFVIIGGVAIVVISVFATVVANQVVRRTSPEKIGYVNVTFSDAMHVCEQSIEKQFADRLLSSVLDGHSSRYSHAEYEYKLFFKLLTRPARVQLPPNAFYSSCFVHSEKGHIVRFEVSEVVDVDESAGQAIRKKDTNLFGFPYD